VRLDGIPHIRAIKIQRDWYKLGGFVENCFLLFSLKSKDRRNERQLG
jgi:hypothetical protein